ncbi:MAG: hypothetical protein ABIQ10_15735 [Gemmatimonadaceae bacterium]
MTIALLVTRGLDILTTYRATPSLAEEANPLTSVLGFKWPALLVSNALIAALLIAAAWRAICETAPTLPAKAGLHFDAFVSDWWFDDETRPWWHALFRLPRDLRLMWYALGRVAPPIVIVMGVVAAAHNSHHYLNRSMLVMVVTLMYASAVGAAIFGLYLFFQAEFRRYRQLELLRSVAV